MFSKFKIGMVTVYEKLVTIIPKEKKPQSAYVFYILRIIEILHKDHHYCESQ